MGKKSSMAMIRDILWYGFQAQENNPKHLQGVFLQTDASAD